MNADGRQDDGGYGLLSSPGPGGIAVMRVWGDAARGVLERCVVLRGGRQWAELSAGAVLRATLVDTDGAPLDDMLVVVQADGSALDVRLCLHGNPVLVGQCAELLAAGGLRAADGAADLWPAGDVVEEEVLRTLPRMSTERGARWLLGQVRMLRAEIGRLASCGDVQTVRSACEELIGRRGLVERFARPMRVALTGAPNAGKSTLANALVDRPMSVVSDVPGTTRDWVATVAQTQGFPVEWVDTPGLVGGADGLAAAAESAARTVLAEMDAVVLVVEPTGSAGAWRADAGLHAELPVEPTCVVLSKADRLDSAGREEWRAVLAERLDRSAVVVSALKQTGLEELERVVLTAAGGGRSADLSQPAAISDALVKQLREIAGQSDYKCMREKLLALIGAATAEGLTWGCETGR